MSKLRSVPCGDDIELGPLSEEVLTDLAPLAEHKDIALNCSGDALVIGSDTLLYRLVFNLVENTIRYSRPGSTVNVSIRDNDSHVFLRVEDQGPGIPKQYRESIFQPFFRLDKPRSRAYGGAGARASACLGDCDAPWRHRGSRIKFRERNRDARDPSKTDYGAIRSLKWRYREAWRGPARLHGLATFAITNLNCAIQWEKRPLTV